MKLKTIQDIMSTEVVSIVRDLPITQAIEEMRVRNIRRLPVIGSTGRLVGLISLNDALIAMPDVPMSEAALGPIPKIKDVMKAYVYTVAPGDSVAQAARLMVNHKISCLPVLEEHRMVGIVTESDIFRYLAEVLEAEAAAGGRGTLGVAR